MREKWNALYSKPVAYIRSHVWFSLVGAVILVLGLLVLIFQQYIKNEYYNYLLDETGKTERAMLSAASDNLNSGLSDALRLCSETATDSTLERVVAAAGSSDGDQYYSNKMAVYEHLNVVCYQSDNLAAAAVVTEAGLLTEYERFWSGGTYRNLWTGDNLDALLSLYSTMLEGLQTDSVDRYAVSTNPLYHESLPELQLFHIAMPLVGSKASFEGVSAVIVLTFRFSDIVQSSSLGSTGQRNYISSYITDQDGAIIYHQDQDLLGTAEEDYLAESAMEVYDQTLNYFGWSAHIAIDSTGMWNHVNQLYHQAEVLYLLLLVLCVALWSLSIRSVLRPLTIIQNAMGAVRRGKHNPRIDVRGTNELWQLAAEYNRMLDALDAQHKEIQRQFEEKARSIEARNQAEREALESQINAHFLCNTLNAINYNVQESGNNEVSRLLKRLSNILHYTFSRETQDVTLGQELEWVEQYLYLQKYRMGDRFSYTISFPEEYGEWPCCKLFLQPFVENSILHGFENRESGGKIKIFGRPEGDRFLIRVSDNGCGIEPELAETIRATFRGVQGLTLSGSGTGIGIQNVVTRMRMFFGERFSLSLETALGEGTSFTFLLPLPAEPEDHDWDYEDEPEED